MKKGVFKTRLFINKDGKTEIEVLFFHCLLHAVFQIVNNGPKNVHNKLLSCLLWNVRFRSCGWKKSNSDWI